MEKIGVTIQAMVVSESYRVTVLNLDAILSNFTTGEAHLIAIAIESGTKRISTLIDVRSIEIIAPKLLRLVGEVNIDGPKSCFVDFCFVHSSGTLHVLIPQEVSDQAPARNAPMN